MIIYLPVFVCLCSVRENTLERKSREVALLLAWLSGYRHVMVVTSWQQNATGFMCFLLYFDPIILYHIIFTLISPMFGTRTSWADMICRDSIGAIWSSTLWEHFMKREQAFSVSKIDDFKAGNISSSHHHLIIWPPQISLRFQSHRLFRTKKTTDSAAASGPPMGSQWLPWPWPGSPGWPGTSWLRKSMKGPSWRRSSWPPDEKLERKMVGKLKQVQNHWSRYHWICSLGQYLTHGIKWIHMQYSHIYI